MTLELNATRDQWNVHVSLFLCTTKHKVKGVAQIYKIKTKIHSTKQGTLSVIEYYNIMKGLWLGFDYYQNVKMKYSEDAAMLLMILERARIIFSRT